MTFALETYTKAKLLDVVVLSQKNRQPDENPGAKLTIEFDMSADMLAHFDGALRSFLFHHSAAKKQGELDGLATETLTPAGAKLGRFAWAQDLSGFHLVIDHGMGGKSNLTIADCTLSKWRMAAKDGGSVTTRLAIESADVSEGAFGRLAKLKSCDISIQLLPPEVAPDLG